VAFTEYQKKRTQERVKIAFGRVLKKYREDKGLTQEKLGGEAEYHSTYISQLERGLKQPSLTTIIVLAKCLDIKPEAMIKAVGKKLTIPQRRVTLKKKSK